MSVCVSLDSLVLSVMGLYACVAVLAVSSTLAAAYVYPPACPACVCKVEAKAADAIVNKDFGPWFRSVWVKEIFTCPPTRIPAYYGRPSLLCYCKEDPKPITKCQLQIWRLRAIKNKTVGDG